MQPISAPEPYTLPHTMRITRNKFIANSVIYLLLIALPVYYLATTNPSVSVGTWTLLLLFAAGMGISYLDVILHEIRLNEDRISYRKWFFWKVMEYRKITAVQFFYSVEGEGGVKFPMLELSGDSGDKVTINLAMFDSPVNRGIIYDVLRKNARRVDLSKSPEDFFIDPAATAGCGNMLPGPYTLPLTLRMDRGSVIILSVIFLFPLAGMVYFGVYLSPPPNMVTWVFFFLMAAFFLLGYLFFILPAVRLTEDRISYRERFFWKEMEYQRITAVRYCYQDTQTVWDSGPVLELSGDTGDKITMSFGMFISAEHLPVIYDVLKKKAPQAGLRNSPGVFFAHPDTTAGS